MNGPGAGERLRLFLERIERLEEEKKGIADDIRDVFKEAKNDGFAPAIMREMLKLRKLGESERREREALIDLYKGALGMLDGTPLGRWAVERATKPAPAEPEDGAAPPEASAPPEPAPPPPPELSIEDARAMGAAAARDGIPVTANPFPARDPRRAAWDEAWCGELGSDGMEIPAALRPKGKPKKGDGGEPKGGEA